MRAAIELVERLGGVVAGRRGAPEHPKDHHPHSLWWAVLCVPTGVAAICIENSEGGKWIQERYKCSHCVPPRLQPRFDQHQLGWD